MIVDVQTPAGTDATYYTNVGDLFEVAAAVEEHETGVFDAVFNRAVAKTLANAGYSVKSDSEATVTAEELFAIIITVEQETTGVFRAALARSTAKALVEAGCSK